MGGPDLLFGISALNDNFLLLWRLAGALAILAPVIGLMHVFIQETLFSELFVFPMLLAPALVVPMLVMLNLLLAWRPLEKRVAGG